MSVSLARAQKHSSDWSGTLANYPTRAYWPKHLFHTAQLEVAVEIIRSKSIVCRNDVPVLLCDVANQGALWNNPNAHRFVRLYFRPRNSFHLKTEGVKAIGDPNRRDPHMSIPIAFAFDLVKILSASTSQFVAGNFAKGSATAQTGDANFDLLDFDLIYHDAAPPAERMAEIHNWRMSEVVVADSLPLTNLSYVICRTIHEERTLRHAIKGLAAPSIIVEQKGSIFMRRGIFLDEVYWSDDMLHISFHHPTSAAKATYQTRVTREDANGTKSETYQLEPKRYRFPALKGTRDAIWTVEIEDCLVYRASAPSASGVITP